MIRIHRLFMVFCLFILVFSPLAAQSQEEEGGMDFNLGIELGAKTFNEDTGTGTTEQVTYQSLSLNPEFIFGKVGIGLGITLNYRFVDDAGDSSFEIREEDWVPEGDKSFFDLYLPIFRYIRYGYKGDPLYAKIGSIEDGTLGTGFIMANYANTLFLPETRIIGLAFDVDGNLFDFPYVGIETFVGNLAQFDVVGSRLYVRPLVNTSLPVINSLQIGATFAADTEPETNYEFTPATDVDTVSMFSFDFIQPLLNKDAITMAFYGDAAFQPGGDELNSGLLVGLGGRMVKFIDYGINTFFLGDNFVPFYFDGTYDLYRESKYLIYSGVEDMPAYSGWQALLGFSFFEDAFSFQTSLDAAFVPDSDKESTLPHLRSTLTVGEGVLPGIFFDVTYDKKYINSFDELIDPEDAVILANLNYKTGPAVITFGYTLRYVPETDDWETTASLSSSISM
ncbi:MAG: hypothetical protein SVR04_05175 [Spirochaetota bacterium]|nr:hypothetical protein [Spirochaetota bacterium]